MSNMAVITQRLHRWNGSSYDSIDLVNSEYERRITELENSGYSNEWTLLATYRMENLGYNDRIYAIPIENLDIAQACSVIRIYATDTSVTLNTDGSTISLAFMYNTLTRAITGGTRNSAGVISITGSTAYYFYAYKYSIASNTVEYMSDIGTTYTAAISVESYNLVPRIYTTHLRCYMAQGDSSAKLSTTIIVEGK